MIDSDGESLGILNIQTALATAAEQGLDLVEVSPDAKPPVCKIIDYGKYKYQKAKKLKESSKNSHVSRLKEIKFHPKTADHDYGFKVRNLRKFLIGGDRVKISVVFRGREIVYQEMGRDLLKRVHDDLIDIATGEVLCVMEGRSMISSYIPDRSKIQSIKE